MSKNNEDLNNSNFNGSNSRKHTVENLKITLNEYEKEEFNYKQLRIKNEDILNFLKINLNMISLDHKLRIQEISNDISEWVDCSKLESEMIDNTLEEINLSTNRDKIKKRHFREKIHVYRESALSALFYSDKNLKSLYYLILNLFIWLLIWVFINDIKSTGQLIDTKFWTSNFSGIGSMAILWSFLLAYSMIVVFYVKLIEYDSRRLGYMNYYIYLIIYLIYQVSIYFIVFLHVFGNDNYHIPLRLIIGCEMVRFSLKIHGYIREKFLYGFKKYHMEYVTFSPEKLNVVEDSIHLPDITINILSIELKNYLYYLFCPSLIYRDTYPRISRYRWNLILAHLTNFICCVLSYYILMRYVCDPYFNFSKLKDYYSLPHFIFDSLRFAIPGVSFLLIGFFLLLHSWLNLWAEILRHGDRRFYEDWWNCTNFEQYYRKWNMVVHEWLYYYVYNDVIRFSLGKLNRFHAKLAVFALSVIVHELIIWLSLGFFFPILSMFFGGPGIIFTYIKPSKKEFNIVFWCKLFLGQGFIFVFYLREFNIRNIMNEIGLIQPWHEWMPRSLLMYMNSYRTLIEQSRFY